MLERELQSGFKFTDGKARLDQSQVPGYTGYSGRVKSKAARTAEELNRIAVTTAKTFKKVQKVQKDKTRHKKSSCTWSITTHTYSWNVTSLASDLMSLWRVTLKQTGSVNRFRGRPTKGHYVGLSGNNAPSRLKPASRSGFCPE